VSYFKYSNFSASKSYESRIMLGIIIPYEEEGKNSYEKYMLS